RLSDGVERHAQKVIRGVWVNRIIEHHPSIRVLRIESDPHQNETGKDRCEVGRIMAAGAEETLEIGGRQLALMVGDVKLCGGILVPGLGVVKNRGSSLAVERHQILWLLREGVQICRGQVRAVDRQVEPDGASSE